MFFSSSGPDIMDIVFSDVDERTHVEIPFPHKISSSGKRETVVERIPLYMDGESVEGHVTIRPHGNARLEHKGIKVELIGTILTYTPDGKEKSDSCFFLSTQQLAAAGDLQHPQTFKFSFRNVEKQYESYVGINVRLLYFIRVTIDRGTSSVVRDKKLWVYSYRVAPDTNKPIKMDVGIEDCLHIEFEYSKCKYHLKDVIVGRIYFLLVRLKIKYMELSIIRKESTGTPPNQQDEAETLMKFEIMDGSPSRGESIPIRFYLSGYNLTPTFKDVNKKFSTRYYLSLVLVDEDARRYFKQSEIVLYRQAPEELTPALVEKPEIEAA